MILHTQTFLQCRPIPRHCVLLTQHHPWPTTTTAVVERTHRKSVYVYQARSGIETVYARVYAYIIRYYKFTMAWAHAHKVAAVTCWCRKNAIVERLFQTNHFSPNINSHFGHFLAVTNPQQQWQYSQWTRQAHNMTAKSLVHARCVRMAILNGSRQHTVLSVCRCTWILRLLENSDEKKTQKQTRTQAYFL